ncbi:MAG: histidine kinase dimerization/phospho-acceptor domain-containing protein [Trebonia sp.]
MAGFMAAGFSWLLGRRVGISSQVLCTAIRALGQQETGWNAPAVPMAAELAVLSREFEATVLRLRESRERGRQMEESRRQLIAWISYDLSIPLAGLRAMTEALENGIATDLTRCHRQVRAEVSRLSVMVDDLSELSRTGPGTASLPTAWIGADGPADGTTTSIEHVTRARCLSQTGAGD